MSALIEARDSLQQIGRQKLTVGEREIEHARFVFPTELLHEWYDEKNINSIFAIQPLEELTQLWLFNTNKDPLPNWFWLKPMPKGNRNFKLAERLELSEPGQDQIIIPPIKH